MKRRRCLIIADACYEWRRDSKGGKARASRPYLFRRADAAPIGLAGLWETCGGPDGSELDTACIVTTDANGPTVAIHDRMPAILEPQDFDAWLDCDGVEPAAAARLLAPAGDDVLEFLEIGTAVNKASHDGPWIQAPVARLTEPSPD